jgi:hypothetical protein
MPGIDARAPGPHRHEQRVLQIAELGADDLLHARDRGPNLGVQRLGQLLAARVELGADLGRDRETGRNRQADVGHLGEVRALAAQQVLHLLGTFGFTAAEEVRALARLLQDRRLGADFDPVLVTILVAILERDLLRFQ